MTRVNLVPPEVLSDEHLLAEYREIPRVWNKATQYLGPLLSGPYRLGKGHVLFFMDKSDYILWRHMHLVQELLRRQINASAIHLPDPGTLSWYPSVDEIQINADRIVERLLDSKREPRYYRVTESRHDAVRRISQWIDRLR